MAYITVGRENSAPIKLHYHDQGTGSPVMLIHGFPVGCRSWEKQVPALLSGGFRVIRYDRRGFGQSSRPAGGYDYDTFAEDLFKVVTMLDLNDVALVGFGMGTGEIARYLGTYGFGRISKVVFISSIPPFLLHTADNPAGIDGEMFESAMADISRDLLSYPSDFMAKCLNLDSIGAWRVNDETLRYLWHEAALASPLAVLACPPTWLTDFRRDLPRIDVPALIVHGDADRILPIESTGLRLHEALQGSRFVVVPDGPHGLIWTHVDVLNPELLGFLCETPSSSAAKFGKLG